MKPSASGAPSIDIAAPVVWNRINIAEQAYLLPTVAQRLLVSNTGMRLSITRYTKHRHFRVVKLDHVSLAHFFQSPTFQKNRPQSSQ
jgi:hypothetical protein